MSGLVRKPSTGATAALLNKIDRDRLPQHVAIIMDGNGRWAKKRGLSRIAGHEAGVNAVRASIEACREIELPMLTLYAFSTENWTRPKTEVSMLWRLLRKYVREELDNLDEEGIRIRAIGRLDKLPKGARTDLLRTCERTKDNTAMTLVIALNYGGRQEIADAARALATDVKNGKIAPGEIDPDRFSKYLYTADLPDPDLLIRTSGECRVSNFLLWQISYAEIVITDVLWPDFSRKDMYKAILEYQARERRFGGVGG